MILTTEQAKKYLRLPNSVTEENFSPFIADAVTKYLPQYLGVELLDKLDDLSEGNFTTEADAEKWNELLSLTRRSLSRFTFFLAAPSLDLSITESGFVVSNTSTMAPASKDRVGAFKSSMEELGYSALDEVLKYLVKNKKVFTQWTSSEAYKSFNSGFIRSADVFQKFINIDSSPLRFFKLREAMDRVELITVIPILGSKLSAALQEEASIETPAMDTVRAEALTMARRCVAYITAAEEIDENKYARYKDLLIGLLRDFLVKNSGKFPELFPEGSEVAPISLSIVNSADSKGFVFGG